MANGNKYKSKTYKPWTRVHEKSSRDVHGTDGGPSSGSNSKDPSELLAIDSKDRSNDSKTKEDDLSSSEHIPESALCVNGHYVYGAVGGLSDKIDPSKLSWTCTANCQEDDVLAIRNSKSQNDLETDSGYRYKVSDSQEKVLPSGGSSHQDEVPSVWDADRSKRVFSNGNEDTQPWPEDTTPSVPDYEKIHPELSGAVNRETTIVFEETEGPAHGDLVPVVSAQHKSQNIDNLLPSSKDRCGIPLREEASVQPTRGIHEEQRLVVRDKCPNCHGKGFHPTIAHNFDLHKQRRKAVLKLCRQSVGHVKCSRCGYLGTSFRIRTCDVVTCVHVIKACMAEGHEIKVEFYNQGEDEKNTILYSMTEQFHDKVLDFAVLKLHDDGAGFPPAFNKFRNPSSADGTNEYLVYLVCFQKNFAGESELNVDCGTLRLKDDTFDKHLENANLKVMAMFSHIKGEAPFGQAHLHKKNGSVPLLSDIKTWRIRWRRRLF
ncbi:uncharacterized protein [Argopecten irradians]|uniref:uncharacterized protein n=1 Tax=Argopecten irradians TaxID=31199 RepID=UPI00371D7C90